MEYKVKINEFEGPLDLLLHLIKEAKVEIWDIKIEEIVEQYLRYIEAMKEMQKENKLKDTANNSMVMFVVLNTASLQLIPTLLTILRQKHGSEYPLDVLPAIWITSIISLTVGIMAAKLFEKRGAKVG